MTTKRQAKYRLYAYVMRPTAAFVCALLSLLGGVCLGAHGAVSERGVREKDESQRDYSHKDLLRSSNNLCIENGEPGCVYKISVPRPHVIFVSIGFRGHAVPLLRIAEQFMKDNPGIRVSFATHHRAREWVKSGGANFLSLGRFPVSPTELRSLLKKISADPSMFRGLLTLFNEVYLPIFEPMYKKMMRIMVNEMPTLVVADVASLGAIDAAQKFKIPLVLNSPTFPFSLDAASYPWLPSWGSGFSIHMSLWDRCMNTLFPRLLSVALTPAFIHLNKLRYGKSMERYQSQHEIFYGRKMLVNTAIGFDHPKPIAHWVDMVGAILPADDDIDATPLPDSLVEWLELQDVSGQNGASVRNQNGKKSSSSSQKRHRGNNNQNINRKNQLDGSGEDLKSNSHGRGLTHDSMDEENFDLYNDDDLTEFTSGSTVIYVNFGWMSRLERRQTDALLKGLTDPRLRVVWTMSNDQKSLLPRKVPPSFKIIGKLGQSTMRLLQREEVKVVVSHCGMGVAQEALMFGKPLLCLPLFGDQIDVAARILDHDIGRVLDKVRMTSSDVRRAILEIVHSYNSISKKAMRVGLTLKLAGGVKRAVEILKHYHEEHIVTQSNDSGQSQTYVRLVDAIPKQPSWFERYYVDVYMVILAIICFVTVVVHNVLRLLLYISVQFLHYARRNGRKSKNSYQGAVDPGSDPDAAATMEKTVDEASNNDGPD